MPRFLLALLIVVSFSGCDEEIRFGGGGGGGGGDFGGGGFGGDGGFGGFGGGWVSDDEKIAKSRHSEVARELQELGAYFEFDDEQDDYPVVVVSFNYKNPSEAEAKRFGELVGQIDTLRKVSASSADGVGDPVIAALVEHEAIRELVLDSSDVTEAGVETLADMTQLEVLDLSSSKCGYSKLEHLSGLTNLRQLSFSASYEVEEDDRTFTDAHAAHVAGLVNLESLTLPFGELTNDGLAHLAGLVRLKEIDLDYSEIDDAGLVHLAGMTELTKILLADCNITDAGLAHIGKLEKLEILDLGGTGVTGSAFADVAFKNSLLQLDMVASHATGEGLDQFPNLESLELGSTYGDLEAMEIDDDDLAKLKGASKLTRVDLSGLDIGDAGIEHLAGVPIDTLYVSETSVTGTGFATWTASPVTDLTMQGCPITTAGAAGIAKLGKLMSLNLSNSDVDDAGIAAIGVPPELRYLDLSGTDVGDEGMKAVGRMTNLGHLDLDNTAVGDAGLAHLGGFRELYSLDLSGTSVTAAGIKTIETALDKPDMFDEDDFSTVAPDLRLAFVDGSLSAGCFVGTDRVAAIGDAWTLHVWRIETGELVQSIPLDHSEYESVVAVRATPDGKRVAISGETLRIVELESEKVTNPPGEYVGAATFSPDGKLLAYRRDDSDDHPVGIVLWNVAEAKEVATLEADINSSTAIAFSADGKRLAVGAYGETLFVWNVESRERIGEFEMENGASRGLAFVGEAGAELVVVDNDRNFLVLDAATGEEKRSLPVEESLGTNFAITADGTLVAVDNYEIPFTILDVATGEKRGELPEAVSFPVPRAFSSDAKWILTTTEVGERSNGHVWDVGKLTGTE